MMQKTPSFESTPAFALDWRILPTAREEDLLAALEAALWARVAEVPTGFGVHARMARLRQRTWTGVEGERSLLTPGFLMPDDDPVVRAAASAVGRRRDPDSPAEVRLWTFTTDCGWSKGGFGIPPVGFAPGEERYAHTNRERLDVEEARWGFHRYSGLVAAVQWASAD